MKIESIHRDVSSSQPRLSARISWENAERPPQIIFFETTGEFAEALVERPEPFLAACFTPALWAGEERIAVDGPVCPEFLGNLEVLRALFQHWFGLSPGAARVEARPRDYPDNPHRSGHAAFFFSGGLDSLASLLLNQASYPQSHPGRFRDGIIVFGLEVEEEEPFQLVLNSLAHMASAAEICLLPVRTNIRSLNPDWTFWWNGYMGAALAAVGHAVGGRCTSVTVASDYDVPHLRPHGSHPLVEPHFSSHEFKVRYDGITLTRLEKARVVCQWAPALQDLRVCNKPQQYEPGRLNCGECEKCLRTMLEFIACGALKKATAFRSRELSAATVVEKGYVMPSIEPYYEEIVEPLTKVEREDLAAAVRLLLARARGEIGWRGRLRKIDNTYFRGGLHMAKSLAIGLCQDWAGWGLP